MKTALVTGSSRGIGRAIAIALHEAGYRVIINYIKSCELAESLAHELGTIAICADVSDPAQVADMFAKIGRVDVLVNNAGICHYGLLSDCTHEQWSRILGVNLGGVYNCTHAVLPQMVERKCGSIVNLGSIAGETGLSYEVAYSASKGAISALTKALAKEMGPSGIRVNAIAPGFIDTEMTANCVDDDRNFVLERTALCRSGSPAEVASLAVFLAGEEASFITGQVISCDGALVL